MELTVTLADPEVDAEAVEQRLTTWLDGLVSDLGLGVSLACRVAVGEASEVRLDDRPLPLRWVVFGSQPEPVADALFEALHEARSELAVAALGAGAKAAERRVAAELAQRCLSRERLSVLTLEEIARLAPGEREESLESLAPEADVELAMASNGHFGNIDLELDATYQATVEAEGDAHPQLAWARLELRKRRGLLVPRFAETTTAAETGFLRLRIHDLRLPPIDDGDRAHGDLLAQLTAHAAALVTLGSTGAALERLKSLFPELVTAVEALHGRVAVTRVLRYLAAEGVDVGRLREICDGLLEIAGSSPVEEIEHIVVQPYAGKLFPLNGAPRPERLSCEQKAECVRMSLARWLSLDARQSSPDLQALLLQPEAEAWLTEADDLAAGQRAELAGSLDRAAGGLGAAPRILTNTGVRRKLWEALHPWRPGVGVLSYSELPPDASIRQVGRLDWTPA